MNGFDPGLPSLLNALRGAGLRIGVAETLQLREVLADQAALDVDELHRVVTAVLVKSAAGRRTLDRLFFTWCDGREAAARDLLAITADGEEEQSDSGEPLAFPEADEQPIATPVTSSWRWRRLFPVAALAVLGILLLTWALAVWAPWSREVPLSAVSHEVLLDLETQPPDREMKPPTDDEDPKPKLPWLWILLTAGLALAGVGVWWLCLGRTPKVPALPPTRPGPRRIRIRVPRPSYGLQLLDLGEEHELVSGIGRYVSDAATDKLDLPATVDATAAAAGFPALRFQFAEEHHCVRIWIDRSATDSQLQRLAADVSSALHRSGLPAEQAFFWGLPSHLSSPDGVAFAPKEIDAWRSRSLVLVFTDGKVLGQLFHAGGRRLEIDDCLRALARWPRLTFVDFGHDDCLRAMLDRHQIPSVQPRQVPDLLSENAWTLPAPEGEEEWGELAGEARAWAAVCALGPEPVDDETALALRRGLGLKVGPWELATVRRASASTASGPMVWKGRRRGRLLGWLCRMEELDPDGKIRSESLLSRAVAAWDNLYRSEAERLRAEEPHTPYETAAARRIELCRALLELWVDPDRAVPRLYQLHGSAESRAAVRQELGGLVPADAAEAADSVGLSWRLVDRPLKIQSMLREMGLGSAAGLVLRRRLVPRSTWGRVLVALWAGVLITSGYNFLRSPKEAVADRSGKKSTDEISSNLSEDSQLIDPAAIEVSSEVVPQNSEQERGDELSADSSTNSQTTVRPRNQESNSVGVEAGITKDGGASSESPVSAPADLAGPITESLPASPHWMNDQEITYSPIENLKERSAQESAAEALPDSQPVVPPASEDSAEVVEEMSEQEDATEINAAMSTIYHAIIPLSDELTNDGTDTLLASRGWGRPGSRKSTARVSNGGPRVTLFTPSISGTRIKFKIEAAKKDRMGAWFDFDGNRGISPEEEPTAIEQEIEKGENIVTLPIPTDFHLQADTKIVAYFFFYESLIEETLTLIVDPSTVDLSVAMLPPRPRGDMLQQWRKISGTRWERHEMEVRVVNLGPLDAVNVGLHLSDCKGKCDIHWRCDRTIADKPCIESATQSEDRSRVSKGFDVRKGDGVIFRYDGHVACPRHRPVRWTIGVFCAKEAREVSRDLTPSNNCVQIHYIAPCSPLE